MLRLAACRFRRGGFRLLESTLQIALAGYGRLRGFLERSGGFPLALPAARFGRFLSFGRRREVAFQFFLTLVVALPDFGLAGGGGREFGLDGAVGTGEPLQRLAAQLRLKRAALALVEAAESAFLMPEILHLAAVTADEGGGLLALFGDPLLVLAGMAESGEGVETRDAGEESQHARRLSGGAFLQDGGAAGRLQFGKRLAFAAVDGGELQAFFLKISPPDSVGLLQGLAALLRRFFCLSPDPVF